MRYIDPTLVEGNYGTAKVHSGINNIVNNNGSTKVENLLENFSEKVEKNCDKIEKVWN